MKKADRIKLPRFLISFLLHFSTISVKDLGLAQNAATTTKSPIPMGSLAHQLYRILCNKGYAMKDFSSVYEYLKDEGSS